MSVFRYGFDPIELEVWVSVFVALLEFSACPN
jgi:hypothetical protein